MNVTEFLVILKRALDKCRDFVKLEGYIEDALICTRMSDFDDAYMHSYLRDICNLFYDCMLCPASEFCKSKVDCEKMDCRKCERLRLCEKVEIRRR